MNKLHVNKAPAVTVQAVCSPLSKGVRGLFSSRHSGGQDVNTPLSPLDRGEWRPPSLDDEGTERLPRSPAPFSRAIIRAGKVAVCLLLVFAFAYAQVQVVPCTLTNADQDTQRLFPERTNFRGPLFMRIDEIGDKRGAGGKALHAELGKRLGDDWDPLWEPVDIPYALYEILKGPDKIGLVFGVNQGWPGADNSQLMMAYDLKGRITEFYYQKLPSFERDKLQTSGFYSQFIGLDLEDSYIHEAIEAAKTDSAELRELDMVARLADPTEKEAEGFRKTLRGLKKTFVLLDDLYFSNFVKKQNVFENVKYVSENLKEMVSPKEFGRTVKTLFPESSRHVVDLVALERAGGADFVKDFEERLGDKLGERDKVVQPVLPVFQDDVYRQPFVRGRLLGFVMPVRVTLSGHAVDVAVAVGAKGKEMGKILSIIQVSPDTGKAGADFSVFLNQFKGLSLVHFYAKDYLQKAGLKDDKLDKFSSLKPPAKNDSPGLDAFARVLKRSLLIVDRLYMDNYLNNEGFAPSFNREEVFKKVGEHLDRKK